MLKLAEQLEPLKGKKSYGYLPKSVKATVDKIVDELERLPVVNECFERWWEHQCQVMNFYSERERERAPLSQQKEFRAIKNVIIREAERLRMDTMERRQSRSAERNHETSTTNHSEQSEAYAAQAATNLLFHLSQIFQQSTAPPKQTNSIRIDSKRRKKLREKRLAQGHKLDDHDPRMEL
jgi:hypothetical protein